MPINRQPQQQGEVTESVSKHELRNAFRSASAKHRRESRKNPPIKPQATFGISCHLCQFVFEQPVSRGSAMLTCPSCGVKFAVTIENHADSIQVSQIEKELQRLRTEIEAKNPNRRENSAKSVIGPLPMQTVKKSLPPADRDTAEPESDGFYSMIGRVRSTLVQLEENQWDDYLRWRNSLKCHHDSHDSQTVSMHETKRETSPAEHAVPSEQNACDSRVADAGQTIAKHPRWEQGRKNQKRIRFALAGIVFGAICCFVLFLLVPNPSSDVSNHVPDDAVTPKNSDANDKPFFASPAPTRNFETPVTGPLSVPPFNPPFDPPMPEQSMFGQTNPDATGVTDAALPIPETPGGLDVLSFDQIVAPPHMAASENVVHDNIVPSPPEQENRLQAQLDHQLDHQLERTRTQLDEVTRQYEQTRRNNEHLERAARQNEAESLLWEAFALSEKSPVRSMVLSLQAIERFEELGLEVPNNARWTLNQSLATQNLGISFNGFQGGVNAMTLSRDGRWFLFADDEGIVWLWDVSKYDQIAGSFPLDTTIPDGVSQLLVTSNVNWGVCVRKNGSLRIWNLRLAEPSAEAIDVADPRCRFTDAVVSEDGRWLAAYGKSNDDRREGGNEVYLWDLNHLAQNNAAASPIVLKGHEKPIRSLVISRNSKWLVSGSEDRTVRVYDLKTAYPAAEQIVLKGHELAVNCVCISPDGRWLVTGGRDSILRIWDMQNQRNVTAPIQLQEHEGWISSLAFSPDGRFLASGSYDNTVRLWRMSDTDRPEVTQVLVGHATPIKTVEFSRQGNRLVSFDLDHEVRLWDLSQGNPSENVLKFRSPQVPIASVMLTGDDRWMIMSQEKPNAASHSGLRLWPLQFGEAFDCAANFAATRFPAMYQRQHDEVVPLPEYQEERIARNESQARTGSQFPATIGEALHETPHESSPETRTPEPAEIELQFPAGYGRL